MKFGGGLVGAGAVLLLLSLVWRKRHRFGMGPSAVGGARNEVGVADEVDDDRRQQVLALTRQVVPEGAQRRPVARSG